MPPSHFLANFYRFLLEFPVISVVFGQNSQGSGVQSPRDSCCSWGAISHRPHRVEKKQNKRIYFFGFGVTFYSRWNNPVLILTTWMLSIHFFGESLIFFYLFGTGCRQWLRRLLWDALPQGAKN
jgi:hypothetical protein